MRLHSPGERPLAGARLAIADGNRGIFQTVGLMREFVKEGRCDPPIVANARALCQVCPEKDQFAEMYELFCFVRDQVRYVADVLDVETISPAWYTLETLSGDCDDQAVLLASLLEAVGIPTRFAITAYSQAREFEHVYLLGMVPDGRFIAMDPTEPGPLGGARPTRFCAGSNRKGKS